MLLKVRPPEADNRTVTSRKTFGLLRPGQEEAWRRAASSDGTRRSFKRDPRKDAPTFDQLGLNIADVCDAVLSNPFSLLVTKGTVTRSKDAT